jgi:hypothetical protein
MLDLRKVDSHRAGGASGNKASTWTRLATIALAVGMMAALAAPAWGQSDDVTLRRDGSKAVPLVADVSVGLGAAAALLTMGAVIAVRRRSTTRAASAAAAR